MTGRAYILGLSTALALTGVTPGDAVAYDPAVVWRTVVSPHFRVHYPRGHYQQALDVARAAETALEELVVRLGWMPETPIPMVLADETDSANGFAQSLPYNLIGLNAVGPDETEELSNFNDWTYGLVGHELAHIVHIDTIGGLPRLVNTVLGRILIPNGVQPRWFVEGLATYFESALTTAGRARSPYSDMTLRMAVLEGAPLDLDDISGSPWRWPQGTIPYLWGAWFVQFLVARHGEDALRLVSHDYGGRLVPFAINASLRHAVDEDYPTAYREFLTTLEHRYRAQRGHVLSAGLREGEPLTRRGQQVGRARIAADGTIYFVESPIGRHTMIEALTVDGAVREVAWAQAGAELALSPDGRQAIVTQPEISNTYYGFGDLFRVDLVTGRTTRLSEGARASGPDLSPDGRQLVFVQRDALHSVVRIAPLADLAAVTTLADLGPDGQVWSPRFSPDGTAVTFGGIARGQRDVFLVTVDGKELRNLTADRAVDGGPVFMPDGEWVVFHSDRDGIFNLYAVARGGGEPRRLTRVLGGAFHPEPSADGAAIVYRSYSNRGFDLSRLVLADEWREVPAEAAADRQPPPAGRARAEVYPVESYRALPTLWPRSWTPVLSYDTRGETVGASVYGTDAVGHHSYSASAWYGLLSRDPGFIVGYRNAQFHPGLTVDLGRSLGFAAMPYVRNGQSFGIEEEIWTGRLGAAWPLWRSVDWSLSLITSYSMQLRQALQAPRFEPTDLTPAFPDHGRFGSLRLILGFSNVRGYLSSISPEEGTRADLSVRLEDPTLGSQYSSVSGTASVTQYLENPWLPRQVLTLYLAGGYGRSSYRQRRLFAISGLPRSDLLLDLLNLRLGTAPALRGFPLVPFSGDALVEAHAEYRFPIYDIEAGVQTLPFYFQALHAAAFVDAAAIADRPRQLWKNRHASVGGELRLDLVFGYGLPATLRVGYGRALAPDDAHNLFVVMGNSF